MALKRVQEVDSLMSQRAMDKMKEVGAHYENKMNDVIFKNGVQFVELRTKVEKATDGARKMCADSENALKEFKDLDTYLSNQWAQKESTIAKQIERIQDLETSMHSIVHQGAFNSLANDLQSLRHRVDRLEKKKEKCSLAAMEGSLAGKVEALEKTTLNIAENVSDLASDFIDEEGELDLTREVPSPIGVKEQVGKARRTAQVLRGRIRRSSSVPALAHASAFARGSLESRCSSQAPALADASALVSGPTALPSFLPSVSQEYVASFSQPSATQIAEPFQANWVLVRPSPILPPTQIAAPPLPPCSSASTKDDEPFMTPTPRKDGEPLITPSSRPCRRAKHPKDKLKQ